MTLKEKFVEKRDFFRLDFDSSLQFKSYALDRTSVAQDEARTKNISESGVLFQTKNFPPQISSLLWMSLDLRTLEICREIEGRALFFKDGVLGKVVHVEENRIDGRFYDVGVCFLTKEQQGSPEIRNILAELSA